MRGLRPDCPALWAPPRCRWSRCRHMCIQGLTGAAAPILTTWLRALGITHHTQIPMQPAAPSLTRTRWTARLERPPVCRHTTRWRTSCGRLNPVAGVACGAFGQTVRHCRGNDPHGSPNAEPYAYVWHRYIRIVGRGQRQHVQQAAHRCYRWQPSPYSHSRGDIGRSCQYPPVLCALIYYAHRITNERA